MNNGRDKIYIKRDLEEEILGYLKDPEIIALVGPRQCGKTTLLKHIQKKLVKANFVTFEDVKTLHLFDNDIDAFISQHVKGYDYLFIDELQYSKSGGKGLKYIYDTEKIKIFVTGSSAVELSIKGLKFLAGRVSVFRLYPLSFREFIRHKDEKLFAAIQGVKLSGATAELALRHFKEFISYGGYPRIVLEKEIIKKEKLLGDILNIYLLRDISEILGIADKDKVFTLAKALSLQLGGLVNYSELSGLTGYDFPALKKHLNLLNETFVCQQVRPFYSNKRTELVKNPKIYFFDSGLRNSIISNFQYERGDIGALFENFVWSELVKYGFSPNYWRSKSKAEVDFIVKAQIPLEVKSHLSKEILTKSFISFIETYSPKAGFVLSESFIGKRKHKETMVNFFPLFYIFKLVERLK
jgi:predicted AAA+ superfamily ATPase